MLFCLYEGIRHRVISCLNIDSGLQVNNNFCDFTGVTVSEPCEVSCPLDCELGSPGAWGSCIEGCGMRAIKTRTRPVLVEANRYGRPCPSNKELMEVRTIFRYNSLYSKFQSVVITG